MKTELSDRALLAVAGPEARNFLQGLITNDIRKLTPDNPLYAALLTPQGKILFDFLLYGHESAILLDCARDSADALHKRLMLYRLRAKVDIARRDDLSVVVAFEGDDAGTSPDPRFAELGARSVVARDDSREDMSERYTNHRLALGVPEGQDFGHDEMFALDADLEELHGVSFDKGCYVGQELTARMKHRGTARKKLLPVEAMSGALPAPGARVSANGSDLGVLASAYGVRGFALLRTDRLAEAQGASIEVDGVPIRVNRPAWLFA